MATKRFTQKTLESHVETLNRDLKSEGIDFEFVSGGRYGYTALDYRTSKTREHCIAGTLTTGTPRECSEVAESKFYQLYNDKHNVKRKLESSSAPLKDSVTDIRSIMKLNGSTFWNRDSMKFFGDTTKSFGVRTIEGKRVLYRKPTATVNVFGERKTAGREHFNCWLWNGSELEGIYNEDDKTQVYNAVMGDLKRSYSIAKM